ncbi:MAG: class II fructose-bisphosphate aldolase [Bifidobacteriaceae bacterium]|jgi:fructose-bisphosphate aldolase class II|nr:class II fructose-bisphosphate aldolase [Bifidobacteriaceae bacterium]
MGIVSPEKYNAMLDRAREKGFAYPAINITSSQTLNAAMKGFADADSDGIVQVSVGGGQYASGQQLKDSVMGSLALAQYARVLGAKYGVNIAIHTDHCAEKYLDSWLRPLLDIEAKQHKAGQPTSFNSHMWDGSSVTLDRNLEIAKELLEKTSALDMILEVEIGVVGGEEDGEKAEINEKLYTTTDDALRTVEALGLGEKGRYTTALTFGNVHGVYKPGAVKLRPELLGTIQTEVGAKVGKERPFDLVFHGGSGSSAEEIALAVKNGVIKMNVDTDTQYAFTRPIAGFMFENYDGVMKVDGEVGNKKKYDPRVWGKIGEESISQRVVEAAQQLGSAGKSMH